MPMMVSHSLIDVPFQVVVECEEIMARFAEEGWPEDDWISIGASWDLNLWQYTHRPLRDQRRATLYGVVDGVIDTKVWIPLVVPHDAATFTY